jgi:hypothetical protein
MLAISRTLAIEHFEIVVIVPRASHPLGAKRSVEQSNLLRQKAQRVNRPPDLMSAGFWCADQWIASRDW